MIHFFDEVKLAHKLKNNEVSSKEKFGYFIIQTLIIYFTYYGLYYGTPTFIISIELMICSVIGIITMYICYRINSKGDDDKFIERFTCLSLPILLRVTVLSIILYLVGLFLDQRIKDLAGSLSLDPEVLKSIASELIINISMLNLYINSFRIISKKA